MEKKPLNLKVGDITEVEPKVLNLKGTGTLRVSVEAVDRAQFLVTVGWFDRERYYVRSCTFEYLLDLRDRRTKGR